MTAEDRLKLIHRVRDYLSPPKQNEVKSLPFALLHQVCDQLQIAMEEISSLSLVNEAEVITEELCKARAELTALKTPHKCSDCESLWIQIGGPAKCTYGLNRHSNINTPWLCGHFKAKAETKQESDDSWNAVAEKGTK
jgi:hypothetical protein